MTFSIMRRFICSVLVLFFQLSFNFYSSAQDLALNSNVTNKLQVMFANLSTDSSRVPTGYLIDRAFEVVDIRDYDGLSLNDCNYTDVSTFKNIILTMNSSVVNSVGYSIDVDEYLNNLADTSSVVLGAAAFKYNHLVSNALTDNLIIYQSGLVYDSYINGILQNPFGTSTVFAFTPNKSSVTGCTVRYKFSTPNIINNAGTIVSYEFDAGDGLGYRSISLPYDSIIDYLSSGIKELKMRISFNDQTILESHSKIIVFPTPYSGSSIYTQPDIVESFSGNYFGEPVSAIVSVKYKTSAVHITKPLIYVEGFDDTFLGALQTISSLSSITDTTSLSNNIYFTTLMHNVSNTGSGCLTFTDLYDNSSISTTIKSTYDIVYVDWSNPLADIRANSRLLEDIISWINLQKINPNSCRNIVYGHSMGGLIARYAIRDMEINGMPHQTSLYVSHDSPHLGANVPIGVLYTLRDLYRMLYDGSTTTPGILKNHDFDVLLLPLINVLESKAARQMLYYYINWNGELDNDVHDDWQEILDDIGFPKGDPGFPIENLSIVNGGDLPGSVNDTLAEIDFNIGYGFFGFYRFLLDYVTTLNNIKASFKIYRNSGGNKLVSKSTAKYNKKFLCFSLEEGIPLITDSIHYSPQNALGLDIVDASILNIDDVVFSRNSFLDSLSIMINGPFPFIPTASALAVTDYNRDFGQAPIVVPRSETPFDSFFLRDASCSHMSNIGIQWDWVHDISNMSINGPSGIAYTGDTFSISSGNYGSSPSWTVSDNSVASISNNGYLTVTGSGPIRITYSNYNAPYRYYHKHRTVLANGLPSDFYLSSASLGNNSYSITAKSTSQQINELLDEMSGNHQIAYIWGIKGSTGNIAWSDTTYTRMHIISATPGTIVHLKVRDQNGRECGGESLFHTISPITGFIAHYSFEPETIYVYQNNVWCIYENVSDPGELMYDPSTGNTYFIPTNYLMVWPDNSGAGLDPDRIIIDGQTIMRDCIIFQTIDNSLTPIYCFNLLNSNTSLKI